MSFRAAARWGAAACLAGSVTRASFALAGDAVAETGQESATGASPEGEDAAGAPPGGAIPSTPQGSPPGTHEDAMDARPVGAPEMEGRVQAAPPGGRARRVTVGGGGGVVSRQTRGGVVLSPAPAFGGWARLETHEWVGVRLGATLGRHAVTIDEGTLLPAGTHVGSPAARVATLWARVEPTWSFAPGWRLEVPLGLGWTRYVVPPPTTRGELSLLSSERTGVQLEWSAGLGVEWEAVPGWLVLELWADHAFTGHATGSLFEERRQAFDEQGRMHHLAEWPEVSGRTAVFLGVGWPL